MDETEAKEDFYRAIADSRAQERADARSRLAAREGEEYAALAEAAGVISSVLTGKASSEALDGVIAIFGRMPLVDYWNSFMEIAAQVILQRALSSRDTGLLEYGLLLMQQAQDGARLSETSIGLVRKAGEADNDAAGAASRMLKKEGR